MVRKGILTPFHKLKGFERRVQHPGTTTEQDASEECSVENLALTSIAKAAESMSQIASTRPATKLLDADALPALEPPTVPFQRLRAPLKRPRSLTEELDEKKGKLKRLKRPKPDKKWRKQDVSKQKSWSGCGRQSVLC